MFKKDSTNRALCTDPPVEVSFAKTTVVDLLIFSYP